MHKMVPRRWNNVGVHPTPSKLVEKFTAFIASRLHHGGATSNRISVLDACAGDGRLGRSIGKTLSDLGYTVDLTVVEVDPRIIDGVTFGGLSSVRVVSADFFSFSTKKRFDIVVSNPPYESIGLQAAAAYGLDWKLVNGCGRNLYGIAIRRCISLCKPGGVVGLIAPHGWVRNVLFDGLRRYARRYVEQIEINAFSSRNLFPAVSQDTALQLLRRSRGDHKNIGTSIFYDAGEARSFELSCFKQKKNSNELKARVGPLVWNRTLDALSSSPTGCVPIVNGGNIMPDGTLWLMPRYSERQYARLSKVPNAYVSEAPLMLIKRTLRGKPGGWKLDYALVFDREFKCVAENHVIVVELPSKTPKRKAQVFAREVVAVAEREHMDHGHPNVSVKLIQKAIASKMSALGDGVRTRDGTSKK